MTTTRAACYARLGLAMTSQGDDDKRQVVVKGKANREDETSGTAADQEEPPGQTGRRCQPNQPATQTPTTIQPPKHHPTKHVTSFSSQLTAGAGL